MAKLHSTYPTSIDTTLQEDRQAGQIITSSSYDIIEDAIFHIESKLGIDSSSTPSSLDYIAKHQSLTLGYIPYRTTDTLGLSNSPLYVSGSNIGLGTVSPATAFEIVTTGVQLRLTSTAGVSYTALWTDPSGNFNLTPTGSSILVNHASSAVAVDIMSQNGFVTLDLRSYSDTSSDSSTYINLSRSRYSSPYGLLNGDVLGSIIFTGCVPLSPSAAFADLVKISAIAEEDLSALSCKTGLNFYTSPTGGATPTKRVTIDGDGRVEIDSFSNYAITNWGTSEYGAGDYGQTDPLRLSIMHGSEASPITSRHTSVSCIRYDDSVQGQESGVYYFGMRDKKTVTYLTLATSLNSAVTTEVVVVESIPTDTLQAGYIEVQTDLGAYTLCSYTKWDTKTFTIASTDFSAGATAPRNVWVVRGAAKNVLVAHAQSDVVTPGGTTIDNGIIALVGTATVLSGSNAFACGVYSDVTLGSPTGAISAFELTLRNWSNAEAQDEFIAGGTTALKITGTGGTTAGGGTSSLHTYAIDVAADAGFGFKTGIHFGEGACTVRAIDLSHLETPCIPLLLHSNTSIESFDAAGTQNYQLIGMDAGNGINIGTAAPASIVIGSSAVLDSPIWVHVNGATVQVSAGANGSGGTGVRALVVANT